MAQYKGPTPTGFDDVSYDLVSILYHCLKGGQVYSKYVEDAERTGKSDIAQFFRDVEDEERQRADRASQLLQQYVSQQRGTGFQRRAA